MIVDYPALIPLKKGLEQAKIGGLVTFQTSAILKVEVASLLSCCVDITLVLYPFSLAPSLGCEVYRF